MDIEPKVGSILSQHVNGYKPLVSEDFTELEILGAIAIYIWLFFRFLLAFSSTLATWR